MINTFHMYILPRYTFTEALLIEAIQIKEVEKHLTFDATYDTIKRRYNLDTL